MFFAPKLDPGADDLPPLDLPPVDGEGDRDDDPADLDADDELETLDDDGDAMDDRTGESAPFEELEGEEESLLLLDTDEAKTLDVGGLDLAFGDEDEAVLDGEDGDGRAVDEDLSLEEPPVLADGGEEGPIAEDEELREEDLPALDADEHGDVDEDALFDRTSIEPSEDLLWEDRAWARIDEAVAWPDDVEESGPLGAPSEDAPPGTRDAGWRALERSGRVTAATLLPGGSVVVALATPDGARARLVRVAPDGTSRILAEVDPAMGRGEDDGEACHVTALRWDATRGWLMASGSFGLQAFRPA